MSYYKNQLDRLDTKGEFQPTVKFFQGDNSTKHFTLNKECAKDIIDFLTKNYL